MDSKVYPILKKGVYNLFILGKIFFKCIPECFYQKKKEGMYFRHAFFLTDGCSGYFLMISLSAVLFSPREVRTK